jgi:hypothetical protein
MKSFIFLGIVLSIIGVVFKIPDIVVTGILLTIVSASSTINLTRSKQ